MQNFINKIEKIYPLSEDERGFLSGKIKYLKIPAKHLLIKKGDIAKNVYYIEKGFMDTYCYDSKGHKRVFNFHFDNEIITNHASFLNETPSTFNLESLEETELI